MERVLDLRTGLLFREFIIVAHFVASRLTCAVCAVKV